MSENDSVLTQRLRNWCQTPETRIPDASAAAQLIQRLGIVTLYPVSPEIPNLYHAYVGDPTRKTDSEWDSPSGHVYAWRWDLGRMEAGFYTAIVRGRPTFVSWDLLPAVLRLRADLRMPDELYDLGALSDNAYRIVRALEAADGPLETGELRAAAHFPTGKEQRASYLKAIGELDARLILAKVFSPDDTDMRHVLVTSHYREYVEAADTLSEERALDLILRKHGPEAVYIVPSVLAKHLKIDESAMQEVLRGLVEEAVVREVPVYRWNAESR